MRLPQKLILLFAFGLLLMAGAVYGFFSISARAHAAAGPEQMLSTTDFSSNWGGTNWTFNTSGATHTAGSTAAAAYNGFAPTANTTYQITYTFSGASGNGIDSIKAGIGGANAQAIYSASSTSVTQVIASTSTGSLQFTPSKSWTGSITSVSVKVLTPPQVSISNASILQGNSGNRVMDFVVTLSQPAIVPTRVTYSTSGDWQTTDVGGTARGVAVGNNTTGADYINAGGVLSFSPGQYQKVIAVTILPNTSVPGTKHFTVKLSNPVNSTLTDAYGSGTLFDGGPTTPSGFYLAMGSESIRDMPALRPTIPVQIAFSDPAPAAFTIKFTTHAVTANGVTNPAIPNSDYLLKTATIAVPAGATQVLVNINGLPNPSNTSSRYFITGITSTLGTITKPLGTVIIRGNNISYNRAVRNAGPPRVALVGDSVTANYTDTAKTALEAKGYAVMEHGVPGSGILDDNECQGQQATTLAQTEDPDITVFENIGNYSWLRPPCNYPTDTFANNYDTPNMFAEWQQAATLITQNLTSNGQHFYWILNPAVNPNAAGWNDVIQNINPGYAQIAANSPTNVFAIDAYTPFGGNPTDCADYRAVDCLHLNAAGDQLMSNLVNQAISTNN